MAKKKAHSVGKAIAVLRKEKGYTQAGLAKKLNITDKAVSKWESEAGFPEISQLPALAEIFEVTIDYLMTGKESKEKIVLMSKIELCAKNDDPKIIESFSHSSAYIKDETGKTLMDYVKQYDSKKVLKALVDSCSHQSHYLALFSKRGTLNAQEMSDVLLDLVQINREQEFLKALGIKYFNKDSSEPNKYSYPKFIHYLIDNYDKLPVVQKDYYFGTDRILNYTNAWTYAYPYFIHHAYENNQTKLFNLLFLKIADTNNDYDIQNEELRRTMGSYYDQHFEQFKQRHTYINVLRETVELAYKNNDAELGDKLNKMCNKPLTEHEKKEILIDNNKLLTSLEKSIEKSIDDRIIIIDELLKIDDFMIIKSQLLKHPIHYIELFSKWLKNKQYRELLEYAVNNDLKRTIDFITSGGYEELEEHILSELTNDSSSEFRKQINVQTKNYKYFFKQDFYPGTRTYKTSFRRKTMDEINKFLNECKLKIIDELKVKADSKKTIDSLTREYFENELSKGNIDIVIVKLCVKLEAILKHDFQYTGDFSEMLDSYCSKLYIDGGRGNKIEDPLVKILHKLRKKRNSIVHSENFNIELTLEELSLCIEHINNMSKGGNNE